MTWTTAGALYDKQRAEQQRDAEGRFAATTPNPFLKDARGHRNVTGINRLCRTNPALARRLCKDAGEVWTAWADTRPRIQSDLGKDLSLGRPR